MKDETHIDAAARDRILLDALSDASAAFVDGRAPGELLPLVLKQVNRLGFDRVRFYSSADGGKVLRPAAHVGTNPGFDEGASRFLDDPLFYSILHDARPRLWRRRDGGLRWFEDLPGGEAVEECAYVPLRKSGELIGLVSADNSVSRRPIGEDGLCLLSLFAPHVMTAAAHNVPAVAARRPLELRSILQLYSATDSSPDADHTFRTACKAVTCLMGADHGALIIFKSHLSVGRVRAEHPALGLSGLELPLSGVLDVEGLRANQQPRVVDDLAGEHWLGHGRATLIGRGLASGLVVPLSGRSGPVGVLCLHSKRRPYPFTAEDADICNLLATHLAVSIENARLCEDERRWSRQLEALRGTMLDITSLDITSKLNREELLGTIIRQAVELLGGKSGGIYEYHPERQELTIVADFNRGENVGKTLRVGEGMAGRLVQAAEPFMIVSDYNQWPHRAHFYQAGRPVGAVIEVPLKWRGQTTGVVYVDDVVGRVFGPEDARLLSLFADQAAIALANARLVTSNETRLKKIELLSHAAAEFLSDITYEDLGKRLELVARRATEILSAEVCGIFLVDEDGMLSLAASYGDSKVVSAEKVRLRIHQEPRGGLTGYIAGSGELFNAFGEELTNHPAVASASRDFMPSGRCTTLLAIPLRKQAGGETKVIGLLRVTNKRGEDGVSLPTLRFTEDDEWILKILSETVVIAIDNASALKKLKAQRDDLSEQKQHLTNVEARLSLLLKAGEIVAQANSLKEGLQNLSELVVSLLSHSFCRILLLDETGAALVANGSCPIEREGAPFEWSPARAARTEVGVIPGLLEFLEAGQPLVVRWSDPEMREQLRAFSERLGLADRAQALLLVPLKIGDEVIGLLNVGEVRSGRSDFTEETIALATDLAAQVGILVRRLWHSERRRTMLVRLGNATQSIMAKYEHQKIYQEAVTLAVGLVGYEAGALFFKQQGQRGLKLGAEFAPGVKMGDIFTPGDALLSAVLQSGESRVVRNHGESGGRDEAPAGRGFKTVIAVPLRNASEVEGVLLVGERTDRRISSEAELEVLERFAEQVSIALQTSVLVDREKLTFRHLEVLHRITDYVMSAQDVERVFDAVLTGVTASYGLGFNRAAVFLLDDTRDALVGLKGIGHLDRAEAIKAWEADLELGISDFRTYVNSLERDALARTPVDDAVAGMRLPVGDAESDPFARALRENECVRVTGDFERLPAAFGAALEPTSPLMIVPISARGERMGLLVVDNKFTRAPITDNDVGALMTFADTAAMAAENIRLFKRIRNGREKLRLLFTASTALSTSREPRQVLKEIIEQTRIAAQATSVALVLDDERGRSQSLVEQDGGRAAGAPPPVGDERGLRLMGAGVYHLIEDRGDSGWQIAEGMGAVSCRQLSLPLSLHGKSFGRMSISYDEPRTLTEFEIDALQLYVNHAAVAYDSARRMDTLNHMRQAAEALASVADSRTALAQIVKGSRAALQAGSAAIWVYDAARNSFVKDGWVASHIGRELRREFWKAEPSPGGTAHTVMERGWVPVTDVRDVHAYPFLGETTRGLLGRIGVHSFIGISLNVGDEPLGVLYINFNQPREFTEEEEQTARTFANHAALALKKTRLVEQLVKAKKAAEAVARVMVLGNREQTLESIAVETRRALDCDIVVLYEYDKATHTLVHPPTMVGLDEEGRHRAMRGGVVEPGSIVYWMLEKDEPCIVEHVERHPMFRNRRFARDERVKSCVGIPIKMQEQKLGVMFINYRTARRFTPDDLSNMGLFSNQAAVAIRNAQLFEARTHQLRQQWELLKFSQQLLGIASLKETMDQAVRIAADILNVECCAIALPDAEGELVVSAAHGWPEGLVGKQRLESAPGSQAGLTIMSRAPVIVEDYQREHRFDVPEFFQEYGARSGLSAPLFVGAESDQLSLVGIMLIHSTSLRRFSDEDQALLRLIANDTAVAIQRTRQYEELKLTRWRIGARTALAWMGMVNNYYQHTIVGHGNTIGSRIELIRAEERRKTPEERIPAWVEKHLAEIASNAKKIVDRPITPPLSSEEGLADLHINELIGERLGQLWTRNPYKPVRLVVALDQDDVIVVRISPEWLRRALDILIDNAVAELHKVPPERRELSVSTRLHGEEVEVLVADRGRGFPADVKDKIFRGKIEKHGDASGLGMGLLMAQAIIETYGGKLEIKETGPEGTTMCIWLPLAAGGGKQNKGEA